MASGIDDRIESSFEKRYSLFQFLCNFLVLKMNDFVLKVYNFVCVSHKLV